MENLEQILKGLGITKDSKHHNYDYLYNQYATIWNKAIEAAAESAETEEINIVPEAWGNTSEFIVSKKSILKLKV